jgi:hypothetical protein
MKERESSKNAGVDGKTLLKLIFRKLFVRFWVCIRFNWLKIAFVSKVVLNFIF